MLTANRFEPISNDRLRDALQTVQQQLLAEVNHDGHWVGELASSAVSTATAVSAMSLVLQNRSSATWLDDEIAEILKTLVFSGANWLSDQQNEDGGWGDTHLSDSNIATTMLVVAAGALAANSGWSAGDEWAQRSRRGNEYIDKLGRLAGLKRRYGKDKTFAVPILTNAALAGHAEWSTISPLPFELACVPQSWYRFMQMPVVSYAIPALVAVGQARFHHRPPLNPIMRVLRNASTGRSLSVIESMQPASGGFLEATPLTSFVTMSLASIGKADSPVVRNGIRFLIDSARSDGSWPIDTNLAAFNTTLAVNGLHEGGFDLGQLSCLDWILKCQYTDRHPFTGADPGGWGWTDLSGSVPDADDTPGALLAIAAWRKSSQIAPSQRERIDRAAASGLRWLADLQNRDGGWPTFCRGWGKLPFDRSGTDLTAHALRAFEAWRPHLASLPDPIMGRKLTEQEMSDRCNRGFRYLERNQRPDGSWIPLWFGNQDVADEENPVYGTARVLLAYSNQPFGESSPAERGYRWLLSNQNEDGGWGGGPGKAKTTGVTSSIEETAVAVAALAANGDTADSTQTQMGVRHLVEAIETGRHRECWPIGFYFAKLWYHERLYPMVFTVDALGRAASGRG